MIRALSDHLGTLAGIIGSLGVILACRKWAWAFLVSLWKFFTGPAQALEMMREIKLETRDLKAGARDRDEKLDRLCKAMFNGGKDGLVNQVAMLAACHKVQFEAAPYPSFQCDGTGNNRAINEAYRLLVGANNGDALAGTRWIHFLHGDLSEDYREEFERCRLVKEDFIGEVDLRNPITGQHRGRWRIHAPCSLVGDDCVFVGRFIAALDPVARDIAMEFGWNVRMG